jgi:PAS domain-containing protein
MRAILPEQLATYFDSSLVALSLGRAEGDHELLLTNEGFRNLTGYATSEIVGRNCRFLQGRSRNEEARAQIRSFLQCPSSKHLAQMGSWISGERASSGA